MGKFILFALLVFSTTLTLVHSVTLEKITLRNWFVGGDFKKAIQKDGSNITLNNIGKFNTTHWNPLGNGTNGPVRVVKLDTCENVYAGGKFTQAGSVSGPIARWSPYSYKWEQIGKIGEVKWSAGAYVNDISWRCGFHKKRDNKCLCRMYIVGKFRATIQKTGKVGDNFIVYDYKTQQWDAMGGNAKHGMGDGEIKAVEAKRYGSTLAQYSVWFGGSFKQKFQRYHRGYKRWGFPLPLPKFNGDVNDIYFQFQPIARHHEVYIVGNFTNLKVLDGRAHRVCKYLRTIFRGVGFKNTPDKSVNFIGNTGFEWYIGGAFLNSKNPYMAKLTKVSGFSSYWDPLSWDKTTIAQISSPILAIDVCQKKWGFSDCNTGSVAVVGKNMVKYFDGDTLKWQDFGGGIIGTGRSIISQPIMFSTVFRPNSASVLSFSLGISFAASVLVSILLLV